MPSPVFVAAVGAASAGPSVKTRHLNRCIEDAAPPQARKEFSVPCGYPATENDIETRMKQGFSVFVINWGDPGFRTIDIGRRIAGR